jgi:tetratricopeptide (TPR) repeat protein
VKGKGLCISSKAESNYRHYIIILLAGSVFTFLIALIPGLIVFYSGANLYVQIACYIFLGLSTWSLLINLVPSQIGRFSRISLENDGKQLQFVLKAKRVWPAYIEACEVFDKQDYPAAAKYFREITAAVPRNRKVLDLLLDSLVCARQFDEALSCIADIAQRFELSADETLKKGYIQSEMGLHDEAIETYSQLLKRDRHNVYALNNLADELVEKGAHKVAAQILEKAIRLKPGFDYPYATFGYSKILQDDLEEGRRLIKQCLDINPENPFAYKALGVNYLKLNNIEQAKVNFNKALELDQYIDLGSYAGELNLTKISD